MTGRKLAIGLAVLGSAIAVVGLVNVINRPRPPGAVKVRPAPGANVLLITLDTTRADHLGAFGGDGDVTPHLDALAGRGITFFQAQSPAPITLVAHSSILSGLYPYHHGVRNNGTFSLPDTVPTLATVLQTEGYHTGAFVSAYVLARRYGLGRGFDIYDDDLSRGRQEQSNVVPSRRAEVTVDAAIDWITALDGKDPFFCWVHLYDPHAPYDPPAEYRRQYPSDPYSGEIAYMDAEIGRLLAHIEELGLTDDTFVTAIGDHGEALGEHGEQTHAILLHQATTKVPWILAGPHLPAGARVRTPVSSVDLLPTLCRLLDVDLPSTTKLDGVALGPGGGQASAERPIYAETMLPKFQYGWSSLRSLRRGKWELVSGVHQELYDLDRDPRELIDRLDREQSAAREMGAELDRIATIDDEEELAQETISESEREKLAALGYVGFSDVERAAPPDPRDLIGAHVHVEKARALAGRGMAEEALIELDVMLADDPQNTSTLSLRAGILAGLGRLADAAEAFEKVIALDPDNAQSYRSLAQLELTRGRPGVALELARLGSEKRGAFGSLTATEATALVALGRVDEAVELLDGRLAKAPDDPELLASRASLHLAFGERTEGESLLRRAVEADALHHRARLALAIVLEHDGRPDDAVALLEDLLKIDPGHAGALARIGAIRLNDPNAARPYLEEAVRLQPRRADYLLRLGVCYIRLGDLRRAEASLRRGLELQPDDRDILNNLSIVLTLQEHYAEAEVVLRRILEAEPGFVEARNNLALCLLYQGRAREAEAEVRHALALDPNLRDARLTLSSILLETRRFAESTTVLSALATEEPDNPEIRARLGIALEAADDTSRALPLLRAAAPAYPQNLELMMALARAEEQAGDPESAQRLFASLAQTSPPGELRDEAVRALERLALRDRSR